MSIPTPILPVELLNEIVFESDSPERLTLCQVSRDFDALCTQALYQNILLTDPVSTVLCCRTLSSNAHLAGLVLHLEINLNSILHGLRSFVALINHAIQNLTSLTVFKIFMDPTWEDILRNCRFPDLRHFESNFNLDEKTAPFFDVHKQLEYVKLSDYSPVNSPALPILSMPRLKYILGNSLWVSPLTRDSQLRAAFVTFNSQDFHDPLTDLSKNQLNVLGVKRTGWNLDMLDLISTRLSTIYVLSLVNLPVPSQDPVLVTNFLLNFFARLTINKPPVEDVQHYLTRFQNLTRLFFHTDDMGRNCFLNREDEYQAVISWGDACPSLQMIAVPNPFRLTWIRTDEGFWIPNLRGSQDSSTLEWLHRRLDSAGNGVWAAGVSKQILCDLSSAAEESDLKESALVRSILEMLAVPAPMEHA